MRKHKNKRSKFSILKATDTLNYDLSTLKAEKAFRVTKVRDLTDSTYVLQFERNGIGFVPGQHITLGLPGDNQIREYLHITLERSVGVEFQNDMKTLCDTSSPQCGSNW